MSLFKRYKCCCYCCSSEKASTIVCTVLYINSLLTPIRKLLEILDEYITFQSRIFYTSILIGIIIAVISLCLLLIGIIIVNKFFLNQFKLAFGIYIIMASILSVYLEIYYMMEGIKKYKEETPSQNNMYDALYFPLCILIVVLLAITIEYYITTYNFINKILQEDEKLQETRNIENGNISLNKILKEDEELQETKNIENGNISINKSIELTN